MPKITDEHREARREQILDAARACVQEHGLEAVSMEMIIARSGLSTGAVYGYFKGKDDIIGAVVTEGTAAMGRQLIPILTDPTPPPLPQLIDQLLRTITEFGREKRDGIDRLLVALHGWSHSQSDPGLKATTRAAYRSQRDLLAGTVRRWQEAGTFDPGADPEAVAQLLQSIILGFVAQRALAGDAGAQAHVAALDALTKLCSAGLWPAMPRAADREQPYPERTSTSASNVLVPFYHQRYHASMALNIKDPETERLAAEVAALTGQTKTGAIRYALRQVLQAKSAPSVAQREERLTRFLEEEIWPLIPPEQLGQPVSKAEREEILGFGPDGA